MNCENLLESSNPSQGQKSWPAGFDMKLDEDLELLSCFKGEPEMDNASKVLKQKQLEKALDRPKAVWNARAFQFTLNQTEKWEKLKNYILGLKNLNYCIACEEKAPTTDHPHIHFYCQFAKAQKVANSKLQGAHVEECYASPQKNLDYIYKRGEFEKKKHNPNDKAKIIFEWGELRESGGAPKTVAQMKNATEEELGQLEISNYQAVKQELIRRRSITKIKDWYAPKTVFYIHGNSGAGKSMLVTWLCEKLNIEAFENIKADKSGFYHNCVGEVETILYDDFRDSAMIPSEFINLIDYNSHAMNVKYGSVVNNYKNIFITSIQSPRDLWPNAVADNQEPKKQWLRRITKSIYIGDDHLPIVEDPKTGEIQGSLPDFKIYLDALIEEEEKKKKEKEEKLNKLLNLIN